MIVVTGADGHIGNVLIRELLASGEKNIRALILPGEDLTPLKGFDIEKIEGDITKPETLTRPFQGADLVFHLAGIIAISHGSEELMEKVNVQGTQNVIDACFKSNVKRLVYTSTIHAIEEPPKGQVITEKLPFKPGQKKEGYDKSKARATIEVLEAVKKGLNAVIVCPSGVIGPYDFRISEMGQLFINVVHKKLFAYVQGAYDFVDVRDVAKGHILAAEKGKTGEVYILSGEQIYVGKIMQILKEITGVKPPRWRMPIWLAQLSADFAPIYYKITKTKPLFTRYSIHTLASNSNISNQKARQELGYSPRPIRESIKDAIQWLKDNNKL